MATTKTDPVAKTDRHRLMDDISYIEQEIFVAELSLRRLRSVQSWLRKATKEGTIGAEDTD